MRKSIAEAIGTFTLVFVGCGAVVLGGGGVGGIALAFGIAIIAMAYSIGPISGCHVNPAVSVAFFLAGRLSGRDCLFYIVAQVIGALLGAIAVYWLLTGKGGFSEATFSGLGQNGWGPGYGGEYTIVSAFIFEVLASFIFVSAILGVTSSDATAPVAGLVIGLTLTGIHFVGIEVTGVSLNPARSLAPALIVGGTAISQVWLFLISPVFGAAFAAWYYNLRREKNEAG